MDVYLIRHGQTDYNKRHMHQPPMTPLDEVGRRQAASLLPIVERIDPTHVIVSPLMRTRETAAIASKNLSVSPIYHADFVEIKRADTLIGRHHFGLVSLYFMLRWFFMTGDADWIAHGGESRDGFLNRLHSAKAYLETLPPDARVVVFTHSVFINFFIAHICNEEKIPFWRAMLLLIKIKKLDNSSVSRITFDPQTRAGVCPWSLVSFDDDAHVVT